MKGHLFLNLICAGALLCAQPATLLFAQATGGAGSTPTQSGPAGPSGGASPTGPTGPGMAGPGNGPETMPTRVDDKKFAKDAALGGLTEVELGKLAAQKASSDQVKQFGQKMVDDHTKANDQLKQIASKENIQIPDTLDSKHQSHIDKLSKLSGDQFDKAFMKDQVKDHETDVHDFQNEAQNGTDPNIKAFASSTLPVLQQHLELAKNLNKAEKKAAKGQ